MTHRRRAIPAIVSTSRRRRRVWGRLADLSFYRLSGSGYLADRSTPAPEKDRPPKGGSWA